MEEANLTPAQSGGQLKKVESIGDVVEGKLVGEYDFYRYLAAFEGKKVRWTLEVTDTNTL